MTKATASDLLPYLTRLSVSDINVNEFANSELMYMLCADGIDSKQKT